MSLKVQVEWANFLVRLLIRVLRSMEDHRDVRCGIKIADFHYMDRARASGHNCPVILKGAVVSR